MLLAALKGERRSRNVAAQTLETLTAATVHRDGGVDVDAADFCEGRRATEHIIGYRASAKVPLVGKKLESFIEKETDTGIVADFEFNKSNF